MTTETPNQPIEDKSEIICSIGRKLEERRKARALTVEKVSQTIKIKPLFIRAIEGGTWKDLPGEVYARGFIGRYATFLGLDPKEVLSPYANLQPTEQKKSPTTQRTMPRSSMPKNSVIWISLSVVFLIGVIKFISTSQKGAVEPPPAAPVKNEIAEAVPTAAPVVPAEKNLAKHTLEVYSPLPLWLSVKAENRSFEGFLPQGATWSWKADGNFSIRLGHTQQVSLVFDGQAITLNENQKKVSLPVEN